MTLIILRKTLSHQTHVFVNFYTCEPPEHTYQIVSMYKTYVRMARNTSFPSVISLKNACWLSVLQKVINVGHLQKINNRTLTVSTLLCRLLVISKLGYLCTNQISFIFFFYKLTFLETFHDKRIRTLSTSPYFVCCMCFQNPAVPKAGICDYKVQKEVLAVYKFDLKPMNI